MVQALNIATGNNPLLKRVVTDHIDFPQVMVHDDDAKRLLEQADGRISTTTMKHIATAMGFLPTQLNLQPSAVPPEQKARIVRAAEKAGIPQRLISTIKQEL